MKPAASNTGPETWRGRTLRTLREHAALLLPLLFICGTLVLLRESINIAVLVYVLALVALSVALHRLRRSAQMMHDERAATQAIFDMAADGILTVDGSGEVLTCNAATAKLFGRSCEDLVG